jgi:hypothetical protein
MELHVSMISPIPASPKNVDASAPCNLAYIYISFAPLANRAVVELYPRPSP